jgi:glyoxylate reductase
LSTSDFVSLHCPLTDKTRHLIDADALAQMKSSAFLINTARGPIVDEEALVNALGAGRIAGAALDVFEEEPRVHPGLLSLDNVLLAPHAGSATSLTRSRMAVAAVRDMVGVLAGRPPTHPAW